MTTASNIFELASKKKYRFDSPRGSLTVEDLWDLPLTSKSGADLDTVAKTVNAKLKAVSEDSFVATVVNAGKGELEVKLELVKYVIAVKLQENADRLAKAEKATQRAKLVDLLGKKQDAALENLSEDEIQKRLAALD